jgi:hypothetical protein
LHVRAPESGGRDRSIADSISRQANSIRADCEVKVDGKLFVSYTHADKGFVDKLSGRLDLEDIKYWRDYAEMVVGESIKDTILRGLERSSGLLLVASPTALQSA